MDTTIKNLGGEQSNGNLSFTWKAFFSDGFILEQFENGIENRFQLVKDKFDQLIRFSLVNKDYSQCFTVDLKNGFILYNNFKNINLEKIDKQNIRLIFFRRHKIKMTEQTIEKSHTIEYHLGLQWNDKEGNNRQIVLIINSEGNFIVGDN